MHRSKRTTVAVLDLLEKVNHLNQTSTSNWSSPQKREGWSTLLEDTLHATGNYAGFGYYKQDEVPAGELPGIIYDPTIDAGGRDHQFPDESRRFYYLSNRLRKLRDRRVERGDYDCGTSGCFHDTALDAENCETRGGNRG